MNPTPFLPAVTPEQFQAMTVRERWVAVARDVIAQLDANRVLPETGSWVLNVRPVSRENLIAAEAEVCAACAVGAAFLSTVRLGNCFEDRLFGFDKIAELMGGVLDEETMYGMEYLYENGEGYVTPDGWVYDDDFGDGRRVVDLDRLPYVAEVEPEKRMRAIMHLLIDNGGSLYAESAA